MNKAQLIETVSTETRMNKAQIEQILNAITSTIKTNVKRGFEVKIAGFGTFAKKKRMARVGRNPQTGGPIKIPASFTPKFKPGSEFRAMVK